MISGLAQSAGRVDAYGQPLEYKEKEQKESLHLLFCVFGYPITVQYRFVST